jgi:polyisoprenoid-binding protein YceI
MRMIAVAAAGLLIAGPTVAAPKMATDAAKPAPAKEATVWTVDKPASRLGFVGAMNGQAFAGTFRRWDAHIRFDPKALATSSVTAVIDTGSAGTGDQTRDEALPTADWFAVQTFPRAIFSASQFKVLGGGRYQAIGTLAIRNVRRPVVLPFTLAIKDDHATMHAVLTIDRRTFGVGQGQFATGDTVATNVKIEVSLSATRAQ